VPHANALGKLRDITQSPPHNRGVAVELPWSNSTHARATLTTPINQDLASRGAKRQLVVDVHVEGRNDIDDTGTIVTIYRYMP